MKARTIVLYTDHADPVACRAAQAGAELLHLDDLLPMVRAGSWPAVLDFEPSVEMREQFIGARVVNRVFSLANTRMDEFLRGSGIDARWLHIRLQSLLESAASVCHDTGVRGVSRTLMPLNVQWFELKRVLADIQTPDFVYSIGYEAPDLRGLVDPLQKSVWSLFDWKQERNLLPEEKRRHQFFVSRPQGVPLVSYFCGESAHGIFFPRGDAVPIDLQRVHAINQAARRAFRSETGELLLFAEGGQLRFHAFSPYLLSVADEPAMVEMLGSWLAADDSSARSDDAGHARVH